MPKFGLKCFLGSFAFSLAAVVAVTKTYSVMSREDATPTFELDALKTKNIELFAHNEENDVLYEKVNRMISATQVPETNTLSEPQENSAELATNLATNTDTSDEAPVYYAPRSLPITDDAAPENSALPTQNSVVELEVQLPPENDDSLKIVDASEAPTFKIPLIHRNMTAPQNNVSVSNSAETHQVALATDDMDVDLLGTDKKTTSQTQPIEDDFDDDPWEVAEVANKNITRNKNAEIAEPEPSGNAVPYKMQDNLLVPIPDDIKKEKNLTPQFSTSAENKKLEEQLRRKRSGQPTEDMAGPKVETPQSLAQKMAEENAKSANDDNGDDDDDEFAGDKKDKNESESGAEQESQSLTDSIAAWFSGGDKKADSKSQGSTAKEDEDEDDDTSFFGPSSKAPKGKKQETSMFRKLLGLSSTSKGGIAPSELKLSFQANRAEISGQTLEWIKAFSENVTKYDDVAIEIRIDRAASYELQQKRLKLLYKILANNGVEYQKINIIFTDREPNSFIIRNVRYVTREERAQATKMENNPWK
jgi:hypothetical protein